MYSESTDSTRSFTFLLRSVYVPFVVKKLLESYTFPYVPVLFPPTFREILLRSSLPTSFLHSFAVGPLAQKSLAVTFLYVPSTLPYVPGGPVTLGFVDSRAHAYWIQVRHCAV